MHEVCQYQCAVVAALIVGLTTALCIVVIAALTVIIVYKRYVSIHLSHKNFSS